MKILDIFKSVKKDPSYLTSRKINELVRQNYRFKNLDKNNKKILLNIIKKRLPDIRAGRGISSYSIEQEGYKLYKNMDKLKLSYNDLKDIKTILKMFKK